MTPRPRGYTHGKAPADLQRYVLVQLKPGWRADESANAFVSGRKRFDLGAAVAAPVSVHPHIAALSRSAARASAAEKELARYVQVRVPGDADLRKIAARLGRLDCIESVTLPPEISLPQR